MQSLYVRGGSTATIEGWVRRQPPQEGPRIWGPQAQMLRLQEEDWEQGPQGLISMGEALRVAGYEVA
eukprot:5075286-Karenia_brevis.AAC.1